MKNKKPSINGFTIRQSADQLGGSRLDNNHRETTLGVANNILLHTTGNDMVQSVGRPQTGRGLGRSDIDESLRGIDNDVKEPTKKPSRKQRRHLAKQLKRPRNIIFRLFKWIIIIAILAAIGAGGYTAYKLLNAGVSIFKGNIIDIFYNQPLKQDSNGRSNFLILGTSEDDPGHDGADLTDSMLVVSVNQNDKDVFMFSVPRDLYVKYGMACVSGYSGKINAYFTCANDGPTAEDEQDRLAKIQKFVGDIFGLDIQYGVHVNHQVIKEAVNAVGGVDVDIQGSNGDPGVLDRNFDWRCNYSCYLVKYTNGVHHLDGEHALYLSMARGDIAPTYGLGNSNFDREANQQKIIIALKDKAMSTGTLTNLSAITSLIDTLGNNLRTNIQTNEIRTLMQVASEVNTDKIYTLSLFNVDSAVVTTGNYGGSSVVMPSAGIFDYSEIQEFIKKNLTNDPIVRESAPIVVLNGTLQSGLGQTKSDMLTDKGYNVTLVDNAPEGTYEAVEIYKIGDEDSQTAEQLATLFNVVIKNTPPPILVDNDVKFVIVFGDSSS